jgi:hypothetical protein
VHDDFAASLQRTLWFQVGVFGLSFLLMLVLPRTAADARPRRREPRRLRARRRPSRKRLASERAKGGALKAPREAQSKQRLAILGATGGIGGQLLS